MSNVAHLPSYSPLRLLEDRGETVRSKDPAVELAGSGIPGSSQSRVDVSDPPLIQLPVVTEAQLLVLLDTLRRQRPLASQYHRDEIDGLCTAVRAAWYDALAYGFGGDAA